MMSIMNMDNNGTIGIDSRMFPMAVCTARTWASENASSKLLAWRQIFPLSGCWIDLAGRMPALAGASAF